MMLFARPTDFGRYPLTAAQIAAGGANDDARYYEAWLAALESLAVLKGLAQPNELERRRAEWDQAYRTTPHGEPVAL